MALLSTPSPRPFPQHPAPSPPAQPLLPAPTHAPGPGGPDSLDPSCLSSAVLLGVCPVRLAVRVWSPVCSVHTVGA